MRSLIFLFLAVHCCADSVISRASPATFINRLVAASKVCRCITPNDVFQYNITATTGGTYTVGMSVFSGSTVTIDWGDGSTTVFYDSSASPVNTSHVYAKAGVYRVRFRNKHNMKTFSHTSTSVGAIAFTVKDLPPALTYFFVSGSNIVSGNLSQLPRTITYLYITGSNILSGNVSSLPPTLGTCLITGSNTVTGNVSGIPVTVTYLYVIGSNTISGTTGDLPPNLGYFYLAGSNTLTGTLAAMPRSVNTIVLGGSNTVSGDLNGLPTGLTGGMQLSGQNTVSGDISGIPSATTYVLISGNNTVSGNISGCPPNATTFYVAGLNTVTGDVANVPANTKYFYAAGNNTVSDYTSGRVWPNNNVRLELRPRTGFGLSSTEVDNLLIDLANIATWASDKVVWVAGNNAARTSASNAAVATLISKGVTVTTN